MKLENRARTIFRKYGISGLIANARDYADITEYLLLLRVKIVKEEYADFLRSITPVLVDLFSMYLKNKCGFDISSYTYIDRNNVMKWDIDLLSGTAELKILDRKYRNTGGLQRDAIVYSDALSEIIVNTAPETDAKIITDDLRNKVEKQLRNKAAHTIISINDDTVKNYTGLSSEDIYRMLVKMLKMCGYQLNENSYEKMNEILISEI